MADGFALIEINKTGDGRLNKINWFDFRLEDICFEDTEGTNQLLSQLPKGISDVLVLIIFDYVCNCSHDYWGDYDCEELFNMVSYHIVKNNYKEFYRKMVTEELKFKNCDTIKSLTNETYYDNIVSDWEEFYNEDFIPFQKEPKMINGVIDLWDLINRNK